MGCFYLLNVKIWKTGIYGEFLHNSYSQPYRKDTQLDWQTTNKLEMIQEVWQVHAKH